MTKVEDLKTFYKDVASVKGILDNLKVWAANSFPNESMEINDALANVSTAIDQVLTVVSRIVGHEITKEGMEPKDE